MRTSPFPFSPAPVLRGLFLAGSSFILSAALLQAEVYYLTPSGSGAQDGSSWQAAFSASSLGSEGIDALVNDTMKPGDELRLGSGDYDFSFKLTSSGQEGRPKRIIGEKTQGELPTFKRSWDRSEPSKGTPSIIEFADDSSFWEISDLKLTYARGIIFASDKSGQHEGITLRNLDISFTRHPLYVSHMKNLLVENVVAREYSKHGFRLQDNCENVIFRNCVADLSGGKDEWWDYSEAYPFGFIIENGDTAPNRNITFENCLAANHRWNKQSKSYYNGDGFVAEGSAEGLTFKGCRAIGNDDGGFDIKPPATYTDCVAVANKRNFRTWHGKSTYTNCLAAYPFSRNEKHVANVWAKYADVTYTNCTIIAAGNSAVTLEDDGKGKTSATAKLIDCIVVFDSAEGKIGGEKVSQQGTMVYSGGGKNPGFVNAKNGWEDWKDWDGLGDAFDSKAHQGKIGYQFKAASDSAAR